MSFHLLYSGSIVGWLCLKYQPPVPPAKCKQQVLILCDRKVVVEGCFPIVALLDARIILLYVSPLAFELFIFLHY